LKKYREHIERNGLINATHLEVSVYYTKGGLNYFSGGMIARGYYISVTPVTISDETIRYTAFTGCSQLMLETQRYSDKQFDRAIEMAKEHRDALIATVVEKNKAA